MRFPILFVLLAILTGTTVKAQERISGRVQDAETGQPLASVHVTVEGSGQGTITNDEGRFTMAVPGLPVTLQAKHIGYVTGRVPVPERTDTPILITLAPAVLELDELFVTGDEFGDNIMRKVIEEKQKWRARYDRYSAGGYTKLVLERDSTIVLLSEAVFDVYWDARKGPREVVKSRRQTGDFYSALPVHAAGHVLNLYDDLVPVQGLDLVGVTHPNALDHYRFVLSGRRKMDDRVVYDLFVSPRDRSHATFIGMISVLDEDYAVVQAALRPAPHLVYPLPVETWAALYTQRFASTGEGVWMPVSLETEGTLSLTIDRFTLRTVGVRQLSRLADYVLNDTLPEAPYLSEERVSVDTTALWRDPLFLLGRDIVPLTAREAIAFERLQRTPLTLRDVFPPHRRGGLLAAFIDEDAGPGEPRFTWPNIRGYRLRLRYNRVDGLLSSVGLVLPLSPRFEAEGRLAQATGLRRVRYFARGRYRWLESGFITALYDEDTQVRPLESVYPAALSSLPSLLGGTDYFDYFWNRRFLLDAGYRFPGVTIGAGVNLEHHEPVERAVSRSWPFKHRFRTNGEIPGGRLNAFRLSAARNEREDPDRATGLGRAEVVAEYSPGGVLGSDFTFFRTTTRVDFSVHTFFRARPRPNRLTLTFRGGLSAGTLPPQRFGTLDGTLGPFAASGTFRSLRGRAYEGEHFAGIFWEHDFLTTLFEKAGLWPLVARGTGLTVYGAHGRTWIDPDRLQALDFTPNYQDAVHHEVGIAVTGILGTPFRVDLTRRLDRPGLFLGFGLNARLF